MKNPVFFKKLEKIYELTEEPLALLKADSSPKDILDFKKTFKDQSVIYAWVNSQTFQCYIGSAKRAQHRPFDHVRSGKLSNVHLQQGLRDFGKNHFMLVILERVAESHQTTKKQLQDAENKYLQKVPRSLQYNIAWYAYTMIGVPMSDDAKEKLSVRMQGSNNPMFGQKGPLAPGYRKTGSSNHMYGKKHTLDARAKISEKAKLRYQSQQVHYRAIPVRFENVKTKESTEPFVTLLAAAKFLGYETSRMIRKALKTPDLILRHEWRVIPLTQEQYLASQLKNQKSRLTFR